MAIAIVSCASREIDPSDIAPVANRLTMLGDRFDFVQRNRVIHGRELEQPPQRGELFRLVVTELRILLKRRRAVHADRMLQLCDHFGVHHVMLAQPAPLILPPHLEIEIFGHVDARIAVRVPPTDLFGHHVDPDALDARRRVREIIVDEVAVQPDGFGRLQRRGSCAVAEIPIFDITLSTPLLIALI